MSARTVVAAEARPRDRSGLVLAVPAVALLALAVFFVLPYYVNDLQQFPLDEVAGGMHDPKDLWPYADGGLVAAVWGWGTVFTIGLAPFAAAIAAGAAVVELVGPSRKGRRRVGRSLATLVLSAAVLAWQVSPMGAALVAWWLD